MRPALRSCVRSATTPTRSLPACCSRSKRFARKGVTPCRIDAAPECDRLRREIERLAVVCPGHVPTLMANAVIAYDEHRPAKAQQFLDQILAQPRSYPDAAVLRARIAIEEGNLPFARRLLEQQIRLAPDHAGLHETYAATLYLERQLPEARRELTTAGALGAPRWRIAYHLGLVEEASGRLDEARRYYAEALEANPAWAPARSRLNGSSRARTAPPESPDRLSIRQGPSTRRPERRVAVRPAESVTVRRTTQIPRREKV